MYNHERIACILYALACIPHRDRVRRRDEYMKYRRTLQGPNREVFNMLVGDKTLRDVSVTAVAMLRDLKSAVQGERARPL